MYVIVVVLRKEVEYEFGVKCEVKYKVKDDIFLDEKVIYLCLILCEKWDLVRIIRMVIKIFKIIFRVCICFI